MDNLLSRNNIMMVAVLLTLYMVWMSRAPKVTVTDTAV